MPPGNVEPDRLDRRPAPTELDAGVVGEAQVARALALVKDGDALQREIERGKLLARAFGLRRGDLGGGDGDAGLGEIDPVELARIIDQGLIAARDDILDDLADGMVHVGRGFALHRQKRRETIPEVGRRRIQTQSHVHLQLEVPAVMTPRRRLRQVYASGMMKRASVGRGR